MIGQPDKAIMLCWELLTGGLLKMAAKLKEIHRTRMDNLNRVVKEQFNGNSSDCARAIERTHTFMWQLVRGYRGIGEASARHIEEKLKLMPKALDQAKDAPRPKTLMLDDGTGKVRNFRVVPVVTMDALDAKARVVTLCLKAECIDKTVCVIAQDEDVHEVIDGDHLYIDRADLEVEAKRVYAVRLKGGAKAEEVVMVTRKTAGGVVFATTRSKTREWKPRDNTVRGRVIMIVREPKL